MKIQLSDNFTYSKLIRFTLPSIVMMIFTSVYSVVDGLFVSNFVGITPFAALNLIFPFPMILGAFGFMLGTGGTALVSMTLGIGRHDRANNIFSMLTYVGIGLGIVLAAVGIIVLRPVALLMGADEKLLPYCISYGRILLCALPAFMLQNMFQSFLIAAEKPGMGLAVTVAAGATNIVLDALFIIVFKWGLEGAAFATLMAQCVGGFVPLFYFSRKNSSLLKLGRAKMDFHALFMTCTNGLSELVTNISMSVVSLLYNFQLMKFAGENGVAAYGAVMYVSFVFVAIFIGYSIGVAPVVGFHYGAADHPEVKSLFGKSMRLISGAGLVMAALAFVLAHPLARLFVGGSEELLEMTMTAFRCYSFTVFFSGFGIFGSAFFTALNNGVVSAAISFLRTIVLQISAVLILPLIFGLDGIWYSLFVAEFLAMLVCFGFLLKNRKKYHY